MAKTAKKRSIYAAAIRCNKFPHLSRKEFDSAYSLAHVARDRGWARMVDEHIHAASPEITVDWECRMKIFQWLRDRWLWMRWFSWN